MNFGKSLWKDESGATAIEYGLLAALIAVVIIGVVASLGGTLKDTFAKVDSQIENPTPPDVSGNGPDTLIHRREFTSCVSSSSSWQPWPSPAGRDSTSCRDSAPRAPGDARVEAPKLREVFVPAQEIAVGTIISPDRLARMEIAESAITSQMVVADAAGEAFLAGSVARQVLPQGVPIARSAIVQPGDRGFLAAVLPRGKRAVTIPISEVAGLNGLALPGDRVDIILTYSVGGSEDSGPAIRASETVLENVRVLALDQRLGPAKPDPEKRARSPTPTRSPRPRRSRSPRGRPRSSRSPATWAPCRSP